MIPNFSRVLFAATLLTAAAAPAQGYYYKSIGNSWLGGSVTATANRSATTTSNPMRMSVTRTANASVSMTARAYVLKQTGTALRFEASARNSVTESGITMPQQSASASARLELAGITVWNRSMSTSGYLGGISPRTYRLFSASVEAPAAVGPFSVRLSGNASVTLGGGASVILPTTTPEVRLIASANTGIVADARVAVGVLGFYAGLELRGTFAEQRLTASLIANVISGFSGSCGYELRGITLRLIAYLEAFWVRVYSTTLTSWSWGYSYINLL